MHHRIYSFAFNVAIIYNFTSLRDYKFTILQFYNFTVLIAQQSILELLSWRFCNESNHRSVNNFYVYVSRRCIRNVSNERRNIIS